MQTSYPGLRATSAANVKNKVGYWLVGLKCR